MTRYGGCIERVIAEQPPGREVHIVAFPDAEAFHRYRTDPDLLALAPQRAAAIKHTELLFGTECADFSNSLNSERRTPPTV